jgi:putative tryptophan/tyrosine transport system substrate-binding protein
MSKIVMYVALGIVLFALSFEAEAQQPVKVTRIGYLSGSSLSVAAARVEAFQHGLRDLVYVEGKNIVIEWRSGEGKLDRNLAHAAELVALSGHRRF